MGCPARAARPAHSHTALVKTLSSLASPVSSLGGARGATGEVRKKEVWGLGGVGRHPYRAVHRWDLASFSECWPSWLNETEKAFGNRNWCLPAGSHGPSLSGLSKVQATRTQPQGLSSLHFRSLVTHPLPSVAIFHPHFWVFFESGLATSKSVRSSSWLTVTIKTFSELGEMVFGAVLK